MSQGDKKEAARAANNRMGEMPRRWKDRYGDKVDWTRVRSSTEGLERRLRRRGRSPDIWTSEEAEEYAKTQPWYERIAVRGCDARYWTWWVRPEEAR